MQCLPLPITKIFHNPFKDYVKFIEDEVGVPIKIVSLGPDRSETIIR